MQMPAAGAGHVLCRRLFPSFPRSARPGVGTLARGTRFAGRLSVVLTSFGVSCVFLWRTQLEARPDLIEPSAKARLWKEERDLWRALKSEST